MNTHSNGRSMFGTLVTWLVVGILALIALRFAIAITAFTTVFVVKLLFTLGPILLVGWVVLKVLRYFTRDNPAGMY